MWLAFCIPPPWVPTMDRMKLIAIVAIVAIVVIALRRREPAPPPETVDRID